MDTDQRIEAAQHAAWAEHLYLAPGIGKTGFRGVFVNFSSQPGNGVPPFSTIVNPGNAPAIRLGNFWTAHEGALAHARYTRDRLASLAQGPASSQSTLPASFWQGVPHATAGSTSNAPAPPPQPAHACPTATSAPTTAAAATSVDPSRTASAATSATADRC